MCSGVSDFLVLSSVGFSVDRPMVWCIPFVWWKSARSGCGNERVRCGLLNTADLELLGPEQASVQFFSQELDLWFQEHLSMIARYFMNFQLADELSPAK